MSGIEKRFPGTTALDGVELEIEQGTIHGLVGENGAGKSTLLKILAGDYAPSAGTIQVDGEEEQITSPGRARELGIGIVYQELSLLPNLSVADNVSLGNEPMRGLRIDEAAVHRVAARALERMGVHAIDVARKVEELPLAERQLVEIAKVLTLERPRVLIFDEPTAALNHHDVERLFAIMRGLRDEGVAIIFVSHRYREVLEICDRLTVLRNGKVVATPSRDEVSISRLIELTLGRKADAVYERRWRSDGQGEIVLEASGLSVGARVSNFELALRRGEIVGLCGLLGSGQDDVARAICGDARDVTGELRLRGHPALTQSPRQALRSGAALISENRQDEGLFPDMSVRENISIASLGRVLWSELVRVVRRSRERRFAREAAERTGVAVRVLSQPVRTLSGGNQQKAILARWLMRGCDVLVCVEPTRGVDVGAKLEIYGQLEALAEKGAAIVVVSTDLPEVLGLSDRILVLLRGRTEAELVAKTTTEQDLLLAMQGGVEGEEHGLLEAVS